MAYDFTVSETVDLADCDRKLTDTEISDVIHRAGFPRSAIGESYGDTVVGLATMWACDLADARCGVPVDLPSGPHPKRGTLRWYRHYIATLDLCADMLRDDWRTDVRRCGPYPWCETAFGPVSLNGRSAPPPPDFPGRARELPRVVGHWPFEMPRRSV